MAAYAAVTSRIQIGSGVINNWTRNIGLLAATFLTLDDLAPDRILCGIGAWWDPLARTSGSNGGSRSSPCARRSRCSAGSCAWRTLPSRASFTRSRESSSTWSTAGESRATVPVFIGATGDKMLELTGEIADGCLLNYCVPPSYNDRALELLAKGAARAGRKLEDIDRPQLIVCSVDRDRERAVDGAKALITQYLAQQPHIAKASGVSEDTVQEGPVDSRLARDQGAGASGDAARSATTSSSESPPRGRRKRCVLASPST